MPTISLKNIIIYKKEDKNFNSYFLIVNKENEEEAYTVFEWKVKEGWRELENNWQEIKEIELEFEEKEFNGKTYRNVINCYFFQEGEIIL